MFWEPDFVSGRTSKVSRSMYDPGAETTINTSYRQFDCREDSIRKRNKMIAL